MLDDVNLNGVREPMVYGAWALPTTQSAPADLSVGGGTPRHVARHTKKQSFDVVTSTPTRSAAPSTLDAL